MDGSQAHQRPPAHAAFSAAAGHAKEALSEWEKQLEENCVVLCFPVRAAQEFIAHGAQH